MASCTSSVTAKAAGGAGATYCGRARVSSPYLMGSRGCSLSITSGATLPQPRPCPSRVIIEKIDEVRFSEIKRPFDIA